MPQVLSIGRRGSFTLPRDAATQTFAILAKRRVGKTYTASVIAEEFAKLGQPFVVLDPTGAWWGLRSSADGKHAGFPVLIVGGAHGDVPLEATAGKVIADLVVDHPGAYVIDLSGFMSNGEQDRFATDFAERLFRRKQSAKFPLHLIVDEADAFMPQRVQPNQARMLGAFEALTRRGGIHGIGMTVITHRPAVLNKNVLTQCEILIILQILSPQDRTAILDYVKGHGTKEQVDTLAREMASLGKGEAYVWSPAWLDVFKKITVRERETFNSSATPKVGEKLSEPTAAAPVDLDKLKDHISATIEKARADDPALLRKRVAELEKELRAKPAAAPAGPSLKERLAEKAAERKEGYADGRIVGFEAGQRDIVGAILKVVSEERDRIDGGYSKIVQAIQSIRLKMPSATRAIASAVRTTQSQTAHKIERVNDSHLVHMPAVRGGKMVAIVASGAEMMSNISGPERRILNAIAWFSAIGNARPEQGAVAFMSGYSGSSNGAYKNPRARLKQEGLVEYEPGDRILLTDRGIAMAHWPAEPGNLAQLHQAILAKLGGPEQRILQPLLDAYPEGVANGALSVAAGYSDASNGAYKNPRARLRSFGLVQYRTGDEVVAAPMLFPEGLK